MWTIVENDGGGLFRWTAPLFSTDKEQDFFHNVAHFQVSRRIKAWQRVTKHLHSLQKEITERSLDALGLDEVLRATKLLVPLLLQSIFEGKSADRTKRRKTTVSASVLCSLRKRRGV